MNYKQETIMYAKNDGKRLARYIHYLTLAEHVLYPFKKKDQLPELSEEYVHEEMFRFFKENDIDLNHCNDLYLDIFCDTVMKYSKNQPLTKEIENLINE